MFKPHASVRERLNQLRDPDLRYHIKLKGKKLSEGYQSAKLTIRSILLDPEPELHPSPYSLVC